jgi:cell wall-associated NlpC family hydrolase
VDRLAKTRKEVVAAARALIGTPYHHQGRLPGKALDRFCEATFEDVRAYDAYGRGRSLTDELTRWLVPVPLDDEKPGDVLTFHVFDRHRATHCGIVTEYGLLHTYFKVKRVVEHTMDDRWKSKRMGAFRFPGVED